MFLFCEKKKRIEELEKGYLELLKLKKDYNNLKKKVEIIEKKERIRENYNPFKITYMNSFDTKGCYIYYNKKEYLIPFYLNLPEFEMIDSKILKIKTYPSNPNALISLINMPIEYIFKLDEINEKAILIE